MTLLLNLLADAPPGNKATWPRPGSPRVLPPATPHRLAALPTGYLAGTGLGWMGPAAGALALAPGRLTLTIGPWRETGKPELGAGGPAAVVLAFTAEGAGSAAVLHWVTAGEQPGDRFEVEAAGAGQAFVVVAAVAGCGLSATPTNYQLTDTQLPAYGTAEVAYRLRHCRPDGTATVSAVCVVTAPASVGASLRVYPAVADVQRPVRYVYRGPSLSADAVLEIHDAAGRCVCRQPGAVAGALNTHGLAPGLYRVSLGTARGSVQADFCQL